MRYFDSFKDSFKFRKLLGMYCECAISKPIYELYVYSLTECVPRYSQAPLETSLQFILSLYIKLTNTLTFNCNLRLTIYLCKQSDAGRQRSFSFSSTVACRNIGSWLSREEKLTLNEQILPLTMQTELDLQGLLRKTCS